ncbi:MAG: hypothetical protein IBX55_00425 [Methyloprofundus sp.]|nr:hypothetical protein [Methyloprofundus sp.]
MDGEVSADRSNEAVNELLNTKPGLVLANNSFEKYGCTYAAVHVALFYPLRVQVGRADVVLKSPKVTGYREIVIGNSNQNDGGKL